MLTQQVEPSEQGRLQGANTSLGSFAGIFGPYLFAQVFAWSIAPGSQVHVPGAAFLLAAGLLASALVVAVRVTRQRGDPGEVSADAIDLSHHSHAAALHAVPASEPLSHEPPEHHP
jgi:DHA1 family tetracycline resistance protein-like MFS transporter